MCWNRRSLAALVLVVASLGFLGVCRAIATGTPTITLNPNTGLSTTALTDPVTVTGTGFVPGSTLYILECDDNLPTAESNCDIGVALGTAFTVPSSGNFTQSFYLVPDDTSAGAGCATSAATMTCEVVVSDNPQTTDDYAESPVTFSADATTTTSAPVTTTTMTPVTTTTVSQHFDLLSVSPNSNLVNGQQVVVRGTGWPANQTYYMVECLRSSLGEGGCSVSELVQVLSDSAGNIPPTTFTVYTGSVGGSDCGSTLGTLDNCDISVTSPTPGSASGEADIAFAEPSPITTTTMQSPTTTTTSPTTTVIDSYVPFVLSSVSPANFVPNTETEILAVGQGFQIGSEISVIQGDGICGNTQLVSAEEISAECIFTQEADSIVVEVSNGLGSSANAVLNAIVRSQPPTAPASLDTVQSGSNLTIRWVENSPTSSQELTSYFQCQYVSQSQVGSVAKYSGTCGESSSSSDSTSFSWTIPFQDCLSQNWNLSIIAVSSSGLQSEATTTNAHTLGACPSQPTISASSPASGELLVKIVAPSIAGSGGAVLGYEYSINGGAWKIAKFTVNRQLRITRLTPSSKVTISLRSSSVAGFSAPSSSLRVLIRT